MDYRTQATASVAQSVARIAGSIPSRRPWSYIFHNWFPVGSQNLYLSDTLIYLTLKNRIRIFLQISFGDVVFQTATLLLRFLLFKTSNHSSYLNWIKKSIGISKKVTLTRNNVDVSNSSFLTQRCKSMRCNLTVTVLDCPMS